MSTDTYITQAPESILVVHPFAATETIPRPNALRKWNGRTPDISEGYSVSPWCISIWKRVFDLMCVVPALLFLSPLLAIMAVAVRLSSPGPVIFRQQRAGWRRKLFTIYKFRTMTENSEVIGPDHTAKDDPRITAIGNFLRRFKLDELPQLYNVLRGDMSLVGPRPKLPHHDYTFLVCRPGVTGAATLAFRNEQHILCEIPQERLESFYRQYVLPNKFALDANYMSQANLTKDIKLLLVTIFNIGNDPFRQKKHADSSSSIRPETFPAPDDVA